MPWWVFFPLLVLGSLALAAVPLAIAVVWQLIDERRNPGKYGSSAKRDVEHGGGSGGNFNYSSGWYGGGDGGDGGGGGDGGSGS